MDKVDLIKYKNTLLKGGVAYSHVKRSLRELSDHADDLGTQLRSRGLSDIEIKESVKETMGSLDLLAEDMLSRPELRSLGHRYPKLTMVLGPILSFSIITLFITLGIVGLGTFYEQLAGEVELILAPAWLKVAVDVLRYCLMYILPPLLSITFGFYALRNAVPYRYFGLGLLILCLVTSAFSFFVQWPSIFNESGSVGIHLGLMSEDREGNTLIYGGKLRLCAVLISTIFFVYLFHKRLDKELI